jgi:hypothetical protein
MAPWSSGKKNGICWRGLPRPRRNDVKAETVNEEGLTFTRVGIALRGVQGNGFVRFEYEPVTP